MLGFYSIPLNSLSKGVELSKWYELNAPSRLPMGGPKGGKPPTTFGSISIAITALNFGSNAPSKPLINPTPLNPSPVQKLETKVEIKQEIKQEIKEVKQEIKQEVKEVKQEIKQEVKEIREEIKPTQVKTTEIKSTEVKTTEIKPTEVKTTEISSKIPKVDEKKPIPLVERLESKLNPFKMSNNTMFEEAILEQKKKLELEQKKKLEFEQKEQKKKIEIIKKKVEELDKMYPIAVKQKLENSPPAWSWLIVGVVFVCSVFSADVIVPILQSII